MSERRQVWATLTQLLKKIEQAEAPAQETSLEQEVRKLGKTQFKANALAEEQAARWEKTLEAQARLLDSLAGEHATAAQQTLLEAILPALDGVDHAIQSGQRYLQIRDAAGRKRELTPTQAQLVSPADRAMLAGWLDGLRLVRARLLALLQAGGVTPIPSVGEQFDPYQHVAVGTSSEAPAPLKPATNLIVTEERPGYRTPAGVLRFAEVIVYRAPPSLP